MWPKLSTKKEKQDRDTKTIAQIVAGDDLCIACGWPADIFNVCNGDFSRSNYCLECHNTAMKLV